MLPGPVVTNQLWNWKSITLDDSAFIVADYKLAKRLSEIFSIVVAFRYHDQKRQIPLGMPLL